VQWIIDDAPLFGDVYGAGNAIAESGRVMEMWSREVIAMHRGNACFALTCHPFISGRGVARGADRGSGTLHAASERRLVHDLRGGAAVARQAAGMSGFDFSNAMVVVTGAGAGIGQGIAQAFHAAGGRVALGDLRKDAVERAAAGLEGERIFAGAVDVRDEKSVQAFFAAAERALGPVTIAVANAGIYPNCPVLDMTVEEWDRVMETNMRGVFLTCQAAARSMKAGARAGKIITISSGAYASGRVGASHYCASKAGVVMFTRVLAMELAEQRINVNCIAPGYIKVDSGTSPLASDFETALLKNIPWGRLGTPADVAPAALFLASPAADYVTGEVLSVNGGAMAGRMYLPLSTPKAR
jgi:3-oxoacyl-[acyl-carrier protein] reductase